MHCYLGLQVFFSIKNEAPCIKGHLQHAVDGNTTFRMRQFFVASCFFSCSVIRQNLAIFNYIIIVAVRR